jgi:hypothetical protein
VPLGVPPRILQVPRGVFELEEGDPAARGRRNIVAGRFWCDGTHRGQFMDLEPLSPRRDATSRAGRNTDHHRFRASRGP